MEKNNQLKPLSIKRITELAEGNHAVVGDLERLAITALCFFDENKSTVKAFQSVGFCLLEREQELEAMQQRAEAAEAKLQAERETSDIIMESLRQKEAKLAELANKKPDIMVSAEGAEAIRAIMNREMSAAGRYVTLKRPSRIGEEGMMGIYIRPAPAVGMDKPEPYAWLVHAPQGDYVERNPEVVAHLEGTGLTKCKPLYLDL